MILGQVFQALPAWQRLSSLKMTPFMAYQMLKYFKLVAAEYDIVEKQRVALIRKLTNTVEGQNAEIKPDTPEFVEYIKLFNEVLIVDCDLKKCSMTMNDVMGAIYDERENALSVQELVVLEPFFSESVE